MQAVLDGGAYGAGGGGMSADLDPKNTAVVFEALKRHVVDGIVRVTLIALQTETGFVDRTLLKHLNRMNQNGTIEIIPTYVRSYRILVDNLNEVTTWTPERFAFVTEHFPCMWNAALLVALNEMTGNPVSMGMLKHHAKERRLLKDRARMPPHPNSFLKKPVVARPVVEKPVVESPTKREPIYAVPRRSVISIRGMPKLVVGAPTARVEGVCSWPLTCGNEARGAYCAEHAAMVRRG